MKKVLFVMFLLSIMILSGCFGISEDFRNYQKDFAKHSSVKTAKKQVEFSLGRFSLYFAEKLTGYFDKDLLAEMTIHDISKFEIGVYEVQEYKSDFVGSLDFEINLKAKGWLKFIKSADGEDVTNIYINVNNDGDEIEQMMIETVDGKNIVLIRLEGNFNRIVKRLIKARRLALK